MRSSQRVAVSLIATLALALAAAAATDPPPATPAAPQETPPMTDEAIAREYFSDLPLLTHDGREVRFFSDLLQDHVVLISSFYTHCKGVSPRQNQVLLRLQEMLGESLGREVFIISITVDPDESRVEHDDDSRDREPIQRERCIEAERAEDRRREVRAERDGCEHQGHEHAEYRDAYRCQKRPRLFRARRRSMEEVDPVFANVHGFHSFRQAVFQ